MKGYKKYNDLGGLEVKGHSRSSVRLPFNCAHITFYLTLIETMRLSCTVFELLSLIFQNLKMSRDRE